MKDRTYFAKYKKIKTVKPTPYIPTLDDIRKIVQELKDPNLSNGNKVKLLAKIVLQTTSYVNIVGGLLALVYILIRKVRKEK